MDKWIKIWIAEFKTDDEFDAYFEEQFEDDDKPISKFAEDQGIDFYDSDMLLIELYDSQDVMLTNLPDMPHSDAYVDAVKKAIEDNNLTGINAFILIDCDCISDEANLSVKKDNYNLLFVGEFEVKE